MRTFAYLTCLTLGAAAQAGIAGLAAAAVLDPGSALVIAVVVALGVLVIGLLEWSHRRGSGLGHRGHGADLGVSADREHLRDRNTVRALDDIRSRWRVRRKDLSPTPALRSSPESDAFNRG
jgi:hypothetical protein